MLEQNYLQWLVENTATTWWHDSGNPDELQLGLAHGATGVTTNPILISKTLHSNPEKWNHLLEDIKKDLSSREQAEFLVSGVVKNAAKMFKPEYERTSGKLGYVCAQVNPAIAADTEAMISMARRFHSWAPNIAVKFPVTAAGLDAMEECASEGITITATVSFTVPQVIAVAERFRKGKQRAQQAGKIPGQCFAVIMIGRLDDYLRDAAKDGKAKVSESDIKQAGLAVTKRAYSIFKKHDYKTTLLIAALRGTYHMEELTGAELIMSIHPKYQALLLRPGIPRYPRRIDISIASEVIKRLETIPEFVCAYEPEGMKPEEFLTYGATQRTLTQFSQAGWMQLEAYKI